ncbi:hypothetical protein TNCV_2155081 [Trichonephila clavipes]|nr:hypothetical protein TNCV_2155081 [Trichonephila clavipes]
MNVRGLKKICVCKNERERLTATNGVAATSRKIIATTFGVRKGTWFSEKQTCYNNYLAFDQILVWQEHECDRDQKKKNEVHDFVRYVATNCVLQALSCYLL